MKYSWSLAFMAALFINAGSFAYRMEVLVEYPGLYMPRSFFFNLWFEKNDTEEDRSFLKEYIEDHYLKNLYWFTITKTVYNTEGIFFKFEKNGVFDWGLGIPEQVTDKTIENTKKEFRFLKFKRKYYLEMLEKLPEDDWKTFKFTVAA